MKYIKTYENYNEDEFIINIDDIVDISILKSMTDTRETVKKGDIVIGVWFGGGGFQHYILKLNDIEDSLGACDDFACYDIEHAWAIFNADDYKKLDPYFETRLNAKKYNI